MHSKTTLPFRSALVLSANSGESGVDKSTLRACGIRSVSTMRSGIQAARLLALQAGSVSSNSQQSPVDIVLCSDQLDDMSSKQFLRLIKTHPALVSFPVVIMSTQATREAVLDAIGAGCAGYVVRPYPQEKLTKQLYRAASGKRMDTDLMQARRELCTKNFESSIAKFTTVTERAAPLLETLFDEGMKHLEVQDWDNAIRSFNKAVRINTLYAEAYLGLSKAWRGKGDTKKSLGALKMAGEAYSRLEKYEKAREVYSGLLKEVPSMRNPLFGTGSALIRHGNFHSAGKAFLEGARLTPEEKVHEYIARACQFTDSPEKAADQVCLAIEKAGDRKLADKLHRRIVGRPVLTKAVPQTQQKSKLPLLQEAMAVMKYTFKTYKQLQTLD